MSVSTMSVPTPPRFDPDDDDWYASAKRNVAEKKPDHMKMRAQTYERYAMANLAASESNNGAKKKLKKPVKARDDTKKKDIVETASNLSLRKVRRDVFSRFVLCHRINSFFLHLAGVI